MAGTPAATNWAARRCASRSVLNRHGIRISMDRKGSWRDNVFVERLGKYEEVYLQAFESVSTAKGGIATYLSLLKHPSSALES